MENMRNKTVGEIVKLDFRAAYVFNSYGIDFCCGGKISVAAACAANGCDESKLIGDLESLEYQSGSAAHDFDSWNISFLTDYIINTHHEYVVKAIQQILPLAQKVVEVHGAKHSELKIIQDLFQQLSNELLLHLQKEELVLFPNIKKLSEAKSDEKNVDKPDFGSLKIPISVMETEHETTSIIMKRLSKLSKNYTSPIDACEAFRVFFGKLKEFQDDLHMHIHLENNILFPKVIEMEQASIEI